MSIISRLFAFFKPTAHKGLPQHLKEQRHEILSYIDTEQAKCRHYHKLVDEEMSFVDDINATIYELYCLGTNFNQGNFTIFVSAQRYFEMELFLDRLEVLSERAKEKKTDVLIFRSKIGKAFPVKVDPDLKELDYRIEWDGVTL